MSDQAMKLRSISYIRDGVSYSPREFADCVLPRGWEKSIIAKLEPKLDVESEPEHEPEHEPEPEPELGETLYDSRHYSGSLFWDAGRIVQHYEWAIRDDRIPSHDTLIGRGLSGTIAAALLGHATNRKFAAVRKSSAHSHSGNLVEGRVGARWLFVDDFIAGGSTLRTTRDAVNAVVPRSTYVGAWLYKDNYFGKPDEERVR